MNRRLSWIERVVLQSALDLLSPEHAEILRKQIGEVKLVQRHASRRVVCFYRTRWRFSKRKLGACLPSPLSEIRLAEVEVQLDGRPAEPIIATVWLVRGRVFSIEFSAPPPGDRRVALRCSRLLFDPADPVDPRCPAADADPCRALLEELGLSSEGLTVVPPLRPAERLAWIGSLRTRLPDDWVEIIGYSDGFFTDSLSVYGLVGLPVGHFVEHSLLVLAEVGGFDVCLCAVQGDQDGQLVLADHEGSIDGRIGLAFRPALHEYVALARDSL